MSVLPLVFPSNISCFSRGSYKVTATPEIQRGVSNLSCYSQEELARKRELPVPPQPRRTGVLARSDDNLAGEDRIIILIIISRVCHLKFLEGTIWWPYVDIDMYLSNGDILMPSKYYLHTVALCGVEMIAMFSTCYNSIFLQSNTREMYYHNL